MATELERHPLHRARRFGVEADSHFGAAREGELANPRVGEKHLGQPRRIGSRQHLKDTRGSTRLVPELDQSNRGQRRLLGRLQHDGTASRQRRRDLTRHHGRREVPRCHRVDRPDRLAHHEQPFVRRVRRHDLPVGALAFLREPFDEAGGVSHLAARLDDGLAHFLGHQPGERRLVAHDGVSPTPEKLRTLEGGLGSPAGKGVDSRVDCVSRLVGTCIGDFSHDVSGGWIDDGEGIGTHVSPLFEEQRRTNFFYLLSSIASVTSCRITAHTCSTCSRSVSSAPIETRTSQRPSSMAGVKYARPD